MTDIEKLRNDLKNKNVIDNESSRIAIIYLNKSIPPNIGSNVMFFFIVLAKMIVPVFMKASVCDYRKYSPMALNT